MNIDVCYLFQESSCEWEHRLKEVYDRTAWDISGNLYCVRELPDSGTRTLLKLKDEIKCKFSFESEFMTASFNAI